MNNDNDATNSDKTTTNNCNHTIKNDTILRGLQQAAAMQPVKWLALGDTKTVYTSRCVSVILAQGPC